MGKVLLIEPQKILQQAISLFLFPEHEVRVEDEAGAAVGSFKDYDLVIIDGDALREHNRLTAEVLRAVQGCKTPTLWLEEEAASQAPKRDKLVVVKKPLEKGTLEAAVGDFLSPGPSRERGGAATPGRAGASKGASKKNPAEQTEQSAFQFIDLVEVVDEEAPPKQGKKAPRKSK
ncbi:MAG: hypothetical protein HYY47_01540 [Deltaproteobacteria bacterium]|nr:hypothetical protein [Deltaproteobacteria bacterium]MBI2209855.1 hypothetical protein [Deltaproteobacteria bacterium]MBI2990811.1 hypothetical protein [Deltaproteobacteria bacterium]